MRYLMNIKYDGLNFYGSQIQKDKRTVLGEINKILNKILNNNLKLMSCSRTDRGVHANDFYLHFDYDKEIDLNKIKNSLNKLLDNDLYIKSIKCVNEEFHSRYSVISKEYLYIINVDEYNPIKRNYELQYNKKIDTKLLKRACKYLVGTHDFKSFTSDNTRLSYLRTINYIKIENQKGIVNIYINSNGFLKYMVRNIVGMLLDINEDKINIKDINKIINSKDRTNLNKPADSCGLYLNKINY